MSNHTGCFTISPLRIFRYKLIAKLFTPESLFGIETDRFNNSLNRRIKRHTHTNPFHWLFSPSGTLNKINACINKLINIEN